MTVPVAYISLWLFSEFNFPTPVGKRTILFVCVYIHAIIIKGLFMGHIGHLKPFGADCYVFRYNQAEAFGI